MSLNHHHNYDVVCSYCLAAVTRRSVNIFCSHSHEFNVTRTIASRVRVQAYNYLAVQFVFLINVSQMNALSRFSLDCSRQNSTVFELFNHDWTCLNMCMHV